MSGVVAFGMDLVAFGIPPMLLSTNQTFAQAGRLCVFVGAILLLVWSALGA